MIAFITVVTVISRQAAACDALLRAESHLQFRYALLSLAALEVSLQVELNGSLYGQDCVFIANDWHASLVPVYLAGAPGHSVALVVLLHEA